MAGCFPLQLDGAIVSSLPSLMVWCWQAAGLRERCRGLFSGLRLPGSRPFFFCGARTGKTWDWIGGARCACYGSRASSSFSVPPLPPRPICFWRGSPIFPRGSFAVCRPVPAATLSGPSCSRLFSRMLRCCGCFGLRPPGDGRWRSPRRSLPPRTSPTRC